MRLKIFIGYDAKEDLACRVAARSLLTHAAMAVSIEFLDMGFLEDSGCYYRATEVGQNDELLDNISNAPMSTSHAIARFFIPHLAAGYDLALFMDGDVLLRGNILDILEHFESKYAVMCVKHNHLGHEGRKKDGMAQTSYPRKNWSSVMLWNLKHPAHKKLTIYELNNRPGRDYHAFYWLTDEEIGSLPAEWNYLVGVTSAEEVPGPKLIHFTLGLPYLPGKAGLQYQPGLTFPF